jgi:CRISPR/Cas system-associated exonuclease Cas4 (RecB family)
VPQVYWAYFGGAVHNLLEHIHRQALQEITIKPVELPALWRATWKPPESWEKERKETMGTTGLFYLTRYLENYSKRLATVYWVEEQVEIPIGEVNLLLTGRLDLACKENGGINIIDFKIRKRTGLAALHQDLQVQVYALAAVKTRGEIVNSVTLHLLGEKPGNEIQEFAWNDSVKKDVEETIQKAGNGIVHEDFDARPGIHCRFCDFRSLCPFSSFPKKPEELEDEITFGAEAKDLH